MGSLCFCSILPPFFIPSSPHRYQAAVLPSSSSIPVNKNSCLCKDILGVEFFSAKCADRFKIVFTHKSRGALLSPGSSENHSCHEIIIAVPILFSIVPDVNYRYSYMHARKAIVKQNDEETLYNGKKSGRLSSRKSAVSKK